ncbi:putative modified peptide [Luteimonas cucumeris]|uniref:Putative modified peptide n=1 Tax=Luteimonas cucumeris TaxID=985012 RepID=A0A562LDW9_9GAMM|nr:NHLP-related RiPP peptide [Luteimonas cucumeris]TWI05818.1 putative modified peptide [Luteimonas cucumeris]
MAIKGNGPAPLDPKVIETLLDRLSTDDDFRSLFQKDAGAALREAGHMPPPAEGMKTGLAASASAGSCLQMRTTDRLASKDDIARDRAKLESTLAMIQGFMCPAELLDGGSS